MANLRTGDYKGFNYATSSQDGIGSGLMLWSGSMILNSAAAYTSYSGVGLELIGNSESYLRFATSTSTQTGEIDIRAQKFFVGTPTTQFISGSGGNIEISSSNFHLTPSGDITMSGTITADAGNIGAWKIIDGKLSGSNATLDAVGAALYHTTKGPGTDTAAAFDQVRDEYYIDFTPDEGPTATAGKYYVKFGPNFAVSESGQLFASGAVFEGTITASAGKIGGYNIGDNTLTTTGFEIGDSTQTYALSSSKFQVTHGGNITASAGKIAGWDIISNTLRAQSSVDSNQGLLLIGGASPAIRVGEIDGDLPSVQMFYEDNNNYGFRISDINALAQGTSRMYLGKDSGNDRYEISGWSLGVNELTGGKMIIRKDGTIESSGFASDVPGSGFRLTAANGGFLEVENAKIRGTLSTTTFEKETVNAVGGQLYVANATVLTGSGELGGSAAGAGIHRATDTTMSVVNVSGFAVNEILTMKKVSDTGFSTEYILVESSSRTTISSATDFSGKIFVRRGYSGSDTINEITSGSLGDVASSPQSYSGSQVIVSTGKIGTGYIRLNANPNDVTTPFIDIVERTGSSIYDIDLKARLGDLSGLSSDRLHGTDPTGQFGLYSKNVFLEGGIVANTGSIGGIQMKNDKLYIGSGTHNNSNTSFYVDNTGKMSLKDKLVWDGSNLTISGQITMQAGSDLTAGLPAGVVSSSVQLTDIINIQANHPFGGVSGSTVTSAKLVADGQVTGSNWYQSGSTALRHQTVNGVLQMSSSNIAYSSTLRSKQTFNRNEGVKITADFTLNDMNASGKVILGFGKNGVTDVNDNYYAINPGAINTAHSIFVNAGSFLIQEGGNTSPNASRYPSSAVAIGDKFRVTIEPFIDRGALYNIYKYPNINTPVWTSSSYGETWASNNDDLDLEIGVMYSKNVLNIDTIQVSTNASQMSSQFASLAQSTANTATASAAAAQATANTANSTANTANSAASTAQAAIDAMESQLVLTNTGMDISSSGQSPNFGLAKFGTSTEFYDGSAAQNLKLKVNSSGVIAYGDDANTYAQVNSSGLTIVEDSANVANFGSTVRVGADATDKSALRVDGSGNLTIGTSNNSSISLDTSGNATFSGSLSASSATFDGFAIARALRQRVVVIGSNFGSTSEAQQIVYNSNPAYNSILYLEHGVEDGTQYTDIYLDGSQGGVEAAHIKLNLTARCDEDGNAIGTLAADVNGVVRACGAIRKIHTMDLGSGDAAAQITLECDIYSYVQLYTKAGSADYFGHSDSGVLAIYHGFDFDAYSDFRLSGEAVAEIQARNLYDLALGGVYNFIIDSSNRMKFIGGTTNPFGSYSGNHMKVKGDLDVGVDINSEIRCTGDVVAFSTSDKTLKDKISPIEHPINKIKNLSGNTFTWNDKAGVTKRGKADIGVIAQEVQKVLPNATREQDGVISVRYEKIIPLLIEGIKEQQQQIDELKKKLEDNNE